jgi:hypothetical protein
LFLIRHLSSSASATATASSPVSLLSLPPGVRHSFNVLDQLRSWILGEALAEIAGVERKIHFFAMDLPHSDACFCASPSGRND